MSHRPRRGWTPPRGDADSGGRRNRLPRDPAGARGRQSRGGPEEPKCAVFCWRFPAKGLFWGKWQVLPDEMLVGVRAKGQGGAGSVSPQSCPCSARCERGRGGRAEAPTSLRPALPAESVPRTGTERAGGESREQLRKHINAP